MEKGCDIVTLIHPVGLNADYLPTQLSLWVRQHLVSLSTSNATLGALQAVDKANNFLHAEQKRYAT
jgi:hypothetical protein